MSIQVGKLEYERPSGSYYGWFRGGIGKYGWSGREWERGRMVMGSGGV